MQIIIDANVVIAMLIKPGKPVELFFKEEIELFAPQLLFKELDNNLKLIADKSCLSEEDLKEFMVLLKQRIHIIPEEEFLSFRSSAESICPDNKDVVYFALALYLKCPVWTNEKKLQQQPIVKVYSTHELIKLFGLS